MSFEDARPVNSIREEYEYIATQKCECGGAWQRVRQALVMDPESVPHDQITVQCEQCSKPQEYWFNISSFFGKPPVFD